jgi:phage head maturation protease
MIQKTVSVTIEKAASKEYDATFILSDPAPDRVGDTIDSPGAYRKNVGKVIPALFGHDHEKIIGAWENLRIESGKLVGDLRTAGTDLGKMIKQLLVDDIPISASIGFSGKGEQNKSGGIHFKEIDVMECSCVAVPCAPGAQRIKALEIAKSFGIELQSSELDANMAASGLSRDPEKVISKAKAAILAANKIRRL